MSVDIDYIVTKLKQAADALTKTDFLTPQEWQQLQQYSSYEQWREIKKEINEIDAVNPSITNSNPIPFDVEDKRRRDEINYDSDKSQALKDKLSKAQTEHYETVLEPSQKELDLCFARWETKIAQYATQGTQLKQDIEALIYTSALINAPGETHYYDRRSQHPTRFFLPPAIKTIDFNKRVTTIKERAIHELEKVKVKAKRESEQEPTTTEQQKQAAKNKPPQETDEMPLTYVPCTKISGIEHKRPDAIARSLKAAKYPVIKKAHRNYCDPEQAGVLFPKWKKHWEEQQEDK